MDKVMAWMTNSFAPKMNKLARNAWIAAIQEAILAAMPMIFIGSFVSLLTAFGGLIPGFPDFTPINTFSMGLLSLYLAYLVPSLILTKKRNRKTAKEAGIAGVAFFLLIAGPSISDDGSSITFAISNLGNGGMISALFAGVFVAAVMNAFASRSFFGEDSAIPDFITVWFDALIPILIIIVAGWLFTFRLKVNLSNIVCAVFSPIVSVGDSVLGFTFFYFFEYSFLYTFGISTWVLMPLETTLLMNGIAANQAAVVAGQAATAVNAYGVGYYWSMGGGGATLALAIMMLLLAKSQKCKIIGKASIVPSICNINEPLVFGAPIAFNPILMVPMWIIGLLAPLATWLVIHFGIVPPVTTTWAFWYLPQPICAYAVGGVAGVAFSLAIFALSWVIYLPFFKVYDKQCLEEEQARAAEQAKKAAEKTEDATGAEPAANLAALE